MRNRSLLLVLGILLGSEATALAQDSNQDVDAEEVRPSPHWTESRSWGWFVIGSSLALGSALTATGLAPDCNGDSTCRVDNSLLVWSGIGTASVGSMFGFIVLQRAEASEAGADSHGMVVTLVNRF